MNNMPARATSQQYEDWAGSHDFSEPVLLCDNCAVRPIDLRVTGYDCCTECAKELIIDEMKRTNSKQWMEIYLDDLIAIGWEAI